METESIGDGKLLILQTARSKVVQLIAIAIKLKLIDKDYGIYIIKAQLMQFLKLNIKMDH